MTDDKVLAVWQEISYKISECKHCNDAGLKATSKRMESDDARLGYKYGNGEGETGALGG